MSRLQVHLHRLLRFRRSAGHQCHRLCVLRTAILRATRGAGDKDLLLTAILDAVKVLACAICLHLRTGRSPTGAAFMAACQVSCAAVVKNIPAPSDKYTTSSGITTVALRYHFVVAYNFSWRPLPWSCISEIFQTRIREPGVAVGVFSQWHHLFVCPTIQDRRIGVGCLPFLVWLMRASLSALLRF
jgi:hypothetical protein